ncbi:MAG: aldehyde dehydrogenase [Armatimonadetes bacterium]|nr:aldehyde dehydrogenase [Armatimonadota bacterium]
MNTTIEIASPVDEQAIGTIPLMGAEEVAAALERAAGCQWEWGERPFAERAEMLVRARDILLGRAEEIAQLIAREQGKPCTEAVTAEVISSLDCLKWCAAEAEQFLQELPISHALPFMADKRSRCIVQPMGVTSILSAWNYPFAIPMCQAAMCVAVGNAAIFRPSSTTPHIGLAIGEIFRAAGVPQAAFQVVTCASSVAESLVTHEAVRLVMFTGSNEVGQRVMTLAAAGPKKIILELGGKDPSVVFEDADLTRAAHGVCWGAFMNAGQSCSSVERVYVQRSVLPAFTEAVVAHAREIVVGDPTSPDTEMGPMTTEDGVRKVEAQVADALARGARLLVGGKRLHGRYFEPTVLSEVTHDMLVMREETFGPLLPIMAFDTEDEAARLANDCPYGLTASVWTRDSRRAERMARRLEAGAVTINDVNYSFALCEAPWGGVKGSGLGRTHGRYGLQEMVSVKFISEDGARREKQLWWYPYDEAAYRFFIGALPAMFAPAMADRIPAILRLIPQFPRLAREANLPSILGRVPEMMLD